MSRLLSSVAVAVVAVASVATIASAGDLRRTDTVNALPHLKVQVGGKSVERTLDGLDPRDFQVLERRSASSVKLGYPATERVRRNGKVRTVKAKPCARITIKLGTVTNEAPADYVAGELVDPTERGEQAFKKGIDFDVFRAWRARSSVENKPTGSSTFDLYLNGVAAERRGTRLVTLTVEARTDVTPKNSQACGGTNSYYLGPGVNDLLGRPVVDAKR